MNTSKQFYHVCAQGAKITFYFFLLAFASVLYLPDMIDKYQKKATTFTIRREQINEQVVPPTITICMDQALKPSFVESTLKNSEYFWRMKRGDTTQGKNTNELFENATYQYNDDFILRYGEEIMGVKLRLGKHNYTINGVDETIVMEPYNTIHHGKCYAVTVVQTTEFEPRKWRLHFKNDTLLKSADMPGGIRLFISSRNASKNVIWAKWPAVEPLVVDLKRMPLVTTRIILKETEWNFHEGNENCKNGCVPEECFSSYDFEALNQDKKNGSDELIFTSCIPVPLKHFFTPRENFTHCHYVPQAGKNSERMMKIFGKWNGEKAISCKNPQYQRQYQADLLEPFYNSADDRIIFYIDFNYKTRVVKEETLIYDTLTLVGTLGGFLGLFIGFSFFGLFSNVFLYILKRIIMKNY